MPVAEPSALLQRLKADKQLPSPPGTALQVLRLCRRPDTQVQEVADAIRSDPALSARLLKYANSSYVGVGREVTSVRNAVLLLGLRAVKLTALGFSVAMPEFQPRCQGFDLRRFWAESFAAATLARQIAGGIAGADREEAFTAGLLANLGCLALAKGCPDEYAQALEAHRRGRPLLEAEREYVGLDHVEFGAQLLADWGLPKILVNAVRSQSTVPEPDEDGVDGVDEMPLARVVRFAIELAPLFVAQSPPTPEQCWAARRLVEDELKLDERAWHALGEKVKADCREMTELFDIELGDPAAIFDLYAEAQQEAASVGMVTQLQQTGASQESDDPSRRDAIDVTTGVANRARFDERFGEALAGLQRGDGHFALIMFDIDHFKKLNDAHGADVGDLLLKQVAQTVKSVLRNVDLLARYDEEKLIVLAPLADQRGACIAAARVRRCVEELRIKVEGQTLAVTVSVGLNVTSDYQECPDAERLIADTDGQLQLSKKAGHNTWSYLSHSASRTTCSRRST